MVSKKPYLRAVHFICEGCGIDFYKKMYKKECIKCPGCNKKYQIIIREGFWDQVAVNNNVTEIFSRR